MGSIGKAIGTIAGVASDPSSVLESSINVAKASGGISNSETDANAPSFAIDTEAARKRKRALALRRGFMSTRRAGTDQGDGSTLQPALQGKTKLGQ